MRRWLSRLGSGALSVVLAAIVWVVAVREEYPQAQFGEPVTVSRSGLSEDLSVFGDILSEVRIDIRAPKARWPELQARDFTAWVDLAGLSAGEHDVRVQVLPPDPQVRVVSVDPPVIRVRLEELRQKTLPVSVNIMDSPAFGYNWHSPVVTPTHVLVSGSASSIDQVSVAAVDFYLRGARAPVERSLRVSARNIAGETMDLVDIAPRNVSVTVSVAQLPGYREIAVLVEPAGTPATGYAVSAVSANPRLVTVQGDPLVLAELSGYITVPVDITGASQDVIERVPLQLPESVSALGSQSIDVQVSIVPIGGVETVRRKPVVQGLGPGLTYTLGLDAVSVFLSGPLPKLLALKPEAAPVILDLNGLGTGVHAIEPLVETPSDIRVEGIAPQTIEVTIVALPADSSVQGGRAGATVTPSLQPRATPTRRP